MSLPLLVYHHCPISCGDKGWYCRIFNDEANGWANINLNGDVNFGQCNKEDSFEGPWYDQDGHCRGSSYDSTCQCVIIDNDVCPPNNVNSHNA